MLLDTWNRQVPPEIILGGEKRFTTPLSDPTQIWVVPGGFPAASLGVKSRSDNRSWGISLQAEYHEGPQDRPSSGIFPQPPTLDSMSWDWIEFHCQPLEDIEVKVTNWVPDPRVICSRHLIQNKSSNSMQISLSLTCTSKSAKKNIQLTRETFKGRNILSGKANHLSLVVFLTGSEAVAGEPSNQLISTYTLEAFEVVELRWILVLSDSGSDSRKFLEEAINLDWDGEIAHRRISLTNQLQIKTGNAEWDFSLAYSQRHARLILNQLFLQESINGSSSLTLNALAAWQLLLALNPLDPSTVAWLLSKTIQKDRTLRPPFPLEAELLWRVHQAGANPEVLKDYIPVIEKNLESWFSRKHDKDGDGIPEETPEYLILLDLYRQQGYKNQVIESLEKDYLETPGLAALLLNEIHQQRTLRDIIPGISNSTERSPKMEILKEFILDSWNDSENRFQTRDYQSHSSIDGFSLPGPIHNGWNTIQVNLPYPSRLKVRIPGYHEESTSQQMRIILHGKDWQGRYRVEELTLQDFIWNDYGGWGTSQSIFTRLDFIVADGMHDNQTVKLEAPSSDRLDLSLIFPIWLAGLPREVKEGMTGNFLLEQGSFWSNFGLISDPLSEDPTVHLSLNLLVIQGLMKARHTRLAMKVLSLCIDAASRNILRDGRLYSTWEPGTGMGLGKPNQLGGTLPVQLFLDLLGVKFLVNGGLVLEESAPLLFPVQLIYRGVEINIQERETIIYRQGRESQTLPRGRDEFVQL